MVPESLYPASSTVSFEVRQYLDPVTLTGPASDALPRHRVLVFNPDPTAPPTPALALDPTALPTSALTPDPTATPIPTPAMIVVPGSGHHHHKSDGGSGAVVAVGLVLGFLLLAVLVAAGLYTWRRRKQVPDIPVGLELGEGGAANVPLFVGATDG